MPKRSRGRPAKDSTKTNIYIEKDVLAELELYLINPQKGRIQYGTLSTLVNGLLRQVITHLRKPNIDPVQVLRAYGIEIMSGSSDNAGDDEEQKQEGELE